MWKFIKSVTGFIAAVLFIAIVFCAIISYKYQNFLPDKQSEMIAKYTRLQSDEYIYTDETQAAERAASKITEFISSVPTPISEGLLGDWYIVIAEKATEQYSQQAEGCMIWEARTIVVDTYADSETSLAIFVHEFGHYFDVSQGLLSKSKEFNEIYLKYKDSFAEKDDMVEADYSSSSSHEFFASVYKEYFLYPVHLQSVAPEAYTYIDQAFTEASNSSSPLYEIRNNIVGFFRNIKQQTAAF